METQNNISTPEQTPAPAVSFVPAAMTTESGHAHWGIIIGSLTFASLALLGGGYYYVQYMAPELTQETVDLSSGPTLDDTPSVSNNQEASPATLAEIEELLLVISETNLDAEVTTLSQSF